MLSAVASPATSDFEIPKSSLNSSKSGMSLDYYAYEKDDVQLKLTTKDGDVLELHATMTQETFIHAETRAGKGNCSGYARGVDGRSVRLAVAGANGAGAEGTADGTGSGEGGAAAAQGADPMDLSSLRSRRNRPSRLVTVSWR